MPNPLPAGFSGDRSSARYFEIRSSEGACYSWNSPPSVLSRLLGELFADQPEDVLSWVHLAVWQLRGQDMLDSKDGPVAGSKSSSSPNILGMRAEVRSDQMSQVRSDQIQEISSLSANDKRGGFRSLFMQLAANSPTNSPARLAPPPPSSIDVLRNISSASSTREDSDGENGVGDDFVLRLSHRRVGEKTPSARSLPRILRSTWSPRIINGENLESVPEHGEEDEEQEGKEEVPAELGSDSQENQTVSERTWRASSGWRTNSEKASTVVSTRHSAHTFMSKNSIEGSPSTVVLDSSKFSTFQETRTINTGSSMSQTASDSGLRLSFNRRATDPQDTDRIHSVHQAAAKRAASTSNLSSGSDNLSSQPSSIFGAHVLHNETISKLEGSFDQRGSDNTEALARGISRGASFVSHLTRSVVTFGGRMGGRLGLKVPMLTGKSNSFDKDRRVSRNVTGATTRRASTTSVTSEAGERQSWMDNFVYQSHHIGEAGLVNSERLPTPTNNCNALLPSAQRQLIWDLVFSICLFFDAWATPFALTYLPDASAQPHWLDVLFTIVFILFCIDIVHNFFVGYIRNSVVVLSLWEAALHYLVTWFTVDIVATLPHLIWLCSEDGRKGVRWVTLLRLVRLGRVHQWVRRLPTMLELNWQLEHLVSFLHFQGAVTLVAHLNSILLAAVQPTSWVAMNTQEALRHYLWCLWRSLSTLTCSGDAPDSEKEGEWLWSMLISLERSILFFMIVSVLAWNQIKNIGHYDFAQEALQEKLLAYVRRARLPIPLQIDLDRVLKVNSKVRFQQQHFDALEAQELPRHLRASICRELWHHRLRTFSLIHEIMKWNAELAQELVMLVRDLYFAPNTRIYNAGEVSNAAYLVITGKLGSYDASTMDWLPGMWVGEKAIVNPELRRSETIFTKERSELMGVPAHEVRKLLVAFEVLPRFEGLLQKKLWKGICGRCGSLGDHFEAECPLLMRKSWPLPPMQRLPGSRHSRDVVAKANKTSTGFDKEFAEFIEQHDMGHLRPLFLKYNVRSLDDVTRDLVEIMVRDKAYQLSELEAGVMHDAAAKFKKRLKRSCTQLLSTDLHLSDSGNHLIFISHSKMEAGTEAALMQKDLENLLFEDPNFADLSSPVFLDTEDLRDLSELQAHVERSHNLLLLLTQNVLARPWVLVEIVTACRVGTKIVLVEIQRRGVVTYNFPSEDFFMRLLNGTELDLGAYGLLRDQNISLDELVVSLRQVFQRIALPFSPHKTANVRQAELLDILKNCKMIEKVVLSPTRAHSSPQQLSRQATKPDLFGAVKTNNPLQT